MKHDKLKTRFQNVTERTLDTKGAMFVSENRLDSESEVLGLPLKIRGFLKIEILPAGVRLILRDSVRCVGTDFGPSFGHQNASV